jgi:hypothetical protein
MMLDRAPRAVYLGFIYEGSIPMDDAYGLTDTSLAIGDVFTPGEWGRFAVQKYDLLPLWLSGHTFFDPTMGEGNLLESLVMYALEKGHVLETLPIANLYGNELNAGYLEKALMKFKTFFGVDMNDNFTNGDILTFGNRSFDVLFGNPPWGTFADLPEGYKQRIKHQFRAYDLVVDTKKLLLGGSRIDIAALVIQKTIKDNLNRGGLAVFFTPLSILMNDGANEQFRTYRIDDISFAPLSVCDLHGCGVFENVSTRYGLVSIRRNASADFPVPYERYESGRWESSLAKPLFAPTDPLSVYGTNEPAPAFSRPQIRIGRESVPRQGVNSCGANRLFFFEQAQPQAGNLTLVNGTTLLPSEYLHPLLTAKNFCMDATDPAKWVLLPYDRSGKPLDAEAISCEPLLRAYLEECREKLSLRKGSIIQGLIKRGLWWAMLGVGPYCFAPYKIVWEAYGRKYFRPFLFDGRWQVNQSLQAYIPCADRDEAERILAGLKNPEIEEYLRSLGTEGTMNWAQPGKIRRFFDYTDTPRPSCPG